LTIGFDNDYRYYSYGASLDPGLLSVFRQSHRIVKAVEGSNDGLVSEASSQWGTYKGTLDGVSHLDLINWTNRLRWFLFELSGKKRKYATIYDLYFSTTNIYNKF